MTKQPRPTSTASSQAPIARGNDITGILPLWPHQLADRRPEGRRLLVATLEKALREERRRGRAGHWSYDIARHAALVRAWRHEREELRALERTLSMVARRSG